MRTSLFFDGNNFYSAWRTSNGPTIDFSRLATWLVERVGGSRLWGAYYYTGIEDAGTGGSDGQQKLAAFLEKIDRHPGYFVRRLPRRRTQVTCPRCHEPYQVSQEKEVDTTMVAEMLRLAAVNAFDIMVLLSGDADLAPAVDGVTALGKQVFVANWGRVGLSTRLETAAYDIIDLNDGVPSFAKRPPATPPGKSPIPAPVAQAAPSTQPAAAPAVDEEQVRVFLSELDRAQRTMSGTGYVGANFFLRKWRGDGFIEEISERRAILDWLLNNKMVEIYDTADGRQALRLPQGAQAKPDDAPAGSEPLSTDLAS